MSKKYYWLKLKRDFFKRHDIRIVENMPNGKDYILFYLKLLCESVDHEGNLRFSERVPYSVEMLSTLTNTNVDIVRSAIQIFTELEMMETLDDGTIFMSELQNLLGSETEWAEKKRLYRQNRTMSTLCPPDVRQEIEKEKELEIEKELEDDINKKYKLFVTSQLTESQYLTIKDLVYDINRFSRVMYERTKGKAPNNMYNYLLQVIRNEPEWTEEI